MTKYIVVQLSDNRWGVQETNANGVSRIVLEDNLFENAYAMCEEYQYNAECHEWALNNSQESEFDYV